MMRSLWTAATGMAAQSLNVDVISNNISNVNTTGFKRGRANFQDLMYQQVKAPGSEASSAGTQLPTGIQVGLGVRAASVDSIFSEGSFQQTDNPLDLTIQGRGFFQIQTPNGDTPIPATVNSVLIQPDKLLPRMVILYYRVSQFRPMLSPFRSLRMVRSPWFNPAQFRVLLVSFRLPISLIRQV
ncbi:flagellar basal-body rod protein FlgG [Mariprofundus micogutta]|uniref:Flagellar basal-body rod protein FlgG n=1 Tax=Mariprofundus micogutta TaxID=1921010 RepID=A0A1L8CKJ3_9PROT|nr:flagellar hook-basal body complex protein [Mariprofundus micogutta]GAV19427.1 flagellar basal-body rod protein FlgG [Mariprofundus micogutta]